MKKGMNWLILVVVIISFNLSGCYVTSQGISRIPNGISGAELRARQRANVLERENLMLARDTMVLNQVKRNISGEKTQRQGYKVILNNRYYLPITFKIVSLDGVIRTAYNLLPNKLLIIYLLPGTYSVSFWNGGAQLAQSRLMRVDGQEKNYQGLSCHAFAYMPEY